MDAKELTLQVAPMAHSFCRATVGCSLGTCWAQTHGASIPKGCALRGGLEDLPKISSPQSSPHDTQLFQDCSTVAGR